jgi:hypothetical protein
VHEKAVTEHCVLKDGMEEPRPLHNETSVFCDMATILPARDTIDTLRTVDAALLCTLGHGRAVPLSLDVAAVHWVLDQPEETHQDTEAILEQKILEP